MVIARAELDARLRHAAEVWRTLRRASRRLAELGERALADREAAREVRSWCSSTSKARPSLKTFMASLDLDDPIVVCSQPCVRLPPHRSMRSCPAGSLSQPMASREKRAALIWP